MTRLVWCDDYSVGDQEIDRQHRDIFSLIDRLEDQDMDSAALSVTFEKLDIYVREHFATEEEKMRACAYPDLDAHMRQHDEFRDWLVSAKEGFRASQSGGAAMGQNIHDFLKDWLLSHILYADQAYRDSINKV